MTVEYYTEDEVCNHVDDLENLKEYLNRLDDAITSENLYKKEYVDTYLFGNGLNNFIEDTGISETIINEQTLAQPIEITTSFDIAVGAKGERKPECKISIKRHCIAGADIVEIVADDIATAYEKVVEMIDKTKLKED